MTDEPELIEHPEPPSPEALPEAYPHTIEVAALRRAETRPSGGFTWVKAGLAAGGFTLLIAVCGLIIAWYDADSEGDEFRSAANCPRPSAVAFDSALGEGVKVLVEQNTMIDAALVAVANGNEAALTAALDGVVELNARAKDVLVLLDTAIKAREASIDLCR